MRITYRYQNNLDYWTKRWQSIEIDESMNNTDSYPLKYATKVVTNKNQKILEAGCGAGRILRFYHDKGYNIHGFDFVPEVIEKLLKKDKSLQVRAANILELPYQNNEYDVVLAFGLYHNLEVSLDVAIKETFRIIKPGGIVCASFRADNLQTYFTDWLTNFRSRNEQSASEKVFHKMNLSKKELMNTFSQAGFEINALYPVINMPILYKFKFLRHSAHKEFNETLGRKEGYKLSGLGNFIQNLLVRYISDQYCNVFVITATKPAT